MQRCTPFAAVSSMAASIEAAPTAVEGLAEGAVVRAEVVGRDDEHDHRAVVHRRVVRGHEERGQAGGGGEVGLAVGREVVGVVGQCGVRDHDVGDVVVDERGSGEMARRSCRGGCGEAQQGDERGQEAEQVPCRRVEHAVKHAFQGDVLL